MTLGKIDYKAYVYDEHLWREWLDKDLVVTKTPAKINSYESGICLPLKKIGGQLCGGIVDSKGTFVAGKSRSFNDNYNDNECCSKSYEFDSNCLEFVDERVVFGGIIRNHFGHMLCEGLSRTWGGITKETKDLKVAFLLHNFHPTRKFFFEILDACGITEERRIIVESPTQFKEVLVPDETQFLCSNFGYRKEIQPVINTITENCNKTVDPNLPKKIYLSRSHFEIHNCIGEEYFDNFFKENGFSIIHPEELTFEQQVKLFSNADIIAGTNGSIILNSMFMKKGASLIVLNRSSYRVEPVGYSIPDIKTYIIDVHNNFLPETQAESCVVFMAPNINWKRFLNDNSSNLALNTEIPFDQNQYITDYVKSWAKDCITPNRLMRFPWLRHETLLDLVKRTSVYFLDSNVSDVDKVLERPKKEVLNTNDTIKIQMQKICRPRISNSSYREGKLTIDGLIEKKFCGRYGFKCSIILSHNEFSNKIDEDDIEIHIENTSYNKVRAGLEFRISLNLDEILAISEDSIFYLKLACKYQGTQVAYPLGNNMSQYALDVIRSATAINQQTSYIIDKNYNGNLVIVKLDDTMRLNSLPIVSDIKKLCRPRISKVEWLENRLTISGLLEKKYCSKPGFTCFLVISSDKYAQKVQNTDIMIPIHQAIYNKHDKGLNYSATINFSDLNLKDDDYVIKFGCKYNGIPVVYRFGDNIDENYKTLIKNHSQTKESKVIVSLKKDEMIHIEKKCPLLRRFKNLVINK